FLTDELGNLKLPQPVNHQRADNQSREQGRETSECRAKSKVAENAERREGMIKLQVEQPIKQLASVPASVANLRHRRRLPRLRCPSFDSPLQFPARGCLKQSHRPPESSPPQPFSRLF